MQRLIKFRGQDFETGEWRYGSYNGVNAGAADVFIIYEKEIFDPVSLGFVGTEIVEKEVKEETVGQYTGLTDKNGVEIYEGDVIEYKAYTFWHRDVIKFTNGEFHGQLSALKEEFQSKYSLGLIVSLGAEVIGNIYENSYLLEAGE